MKLSILSLEQSKKGEKELPVQFNEEYRPDLIRRAVYSLHSKSRQLYGAHPEAGKRHSSKLSKRRRDYRGCYGFGISRVNRKILSRRGTRMSWVGALTPQTRGGRRAHPPKSEKVLEHKINKKENRKAIRSAMSATIIKELVAHRGHKVPEFYPFIVDGSFEELSRTRDVEKILLSLGFEGELNRAKVKKVRAGQGKLRGRKYITKKGLLIVVSKECPLVKAARTIPGTDIIEAKALNVKLLAPGASPGRVTLWTEPAVDLIKKEKLFI